MLNMLRNCGYFILLQANSTFFTTEMLKNNLTCSTLVLQIQLRLMLAEDKPSNRIHSSILIA